jgi:hypothetical protein
MKRVYVGLSLMLSLPLAAADLTFIDYRGQLLNGELPVTTPTALAFRLCRGGQPDSPFVACGGGVLLYQEAFNVIPDERGRFALRLGAAAPGIDSVLLDTTSVLTLEVNVDGETLLPRQSLSLNRNTAASGSYEMESVAGTVTRGLISIQGQMRVGVPAGSTASAALWLSQNNTPSDNGIWAIAARSSGTPGHLAVYSQGGNKDVLTLLPSGDASVPNGNVALGGTIAGSDRLTVAGSVRVGATSVIDASGTWTGSPANLPGQTGAVGARGPTGVAGGPGPLGPIGPNGASGPTIPGVPGPTGGVGPMGATGHTGAAGNAGAPGPHASFTVCLRSEVGSLSCGCGTTLFDSGVISSGSCTAPLAAQSCTEFACPTCFPPSSARCCVCG